MIHRLAATMTAGCLGLACLSACGSSGHQSVSNTTSPKASAGGPSAAGAPILIGELAPVNAPFYSIPDQVAAVRAAIASINASGGVGGRPLKLDFCNEANDPNKTVACARQLIGDGVVATVADQTVTVGATMTQLFAAAHVAQVGIIPTVSAEVNSPDDFPFMNAGWTDGGAAAASIRASHATKVIVVHPNNPSTIYPETDTAIHIAGASEASPVILPLTAITDYSPYAEQVIKSGAKLVVSVTTATETIGILNAVRQLGSNVPFAINDAALSDSQITQLGANANGLYIFAANPWVNDASAYPGIGKFVASMNAEQARGDSAASIADARPISGSSWLVTYALKQVLSQMVAAHQAITASNVLLAFSKAKDLDTMGLVANKWSPSLKQTIVPGYANMSNVYGYLLKVINGQPSLAQKSPIDVTKSLK